MKVFLQQDLESFVDDRGSIFNLIPKGEAVIIKSFQMITGVKGAQRGNHYHKSDVHYCHVVSGEILYESRNRETGTVEVIHLYPGMTVANEANEIHRFTFITDGAFIALSTNDRDQAHYEEDTIRETL